MSIKLEDGTTMEMAIGGQPNTVLISQPIPTSSQIVLSPADDDPVYLHYVLPSDTVIVPSGTTITQHDGYITTSDAMDSSMNDVLNAREIYTPIESSNYIYNTVNTRYNTFKEKAVMDEERKAQKKIRQAEAARNRYHRLNDDERKALNLKRTIAMKRKRQRDREMAELEAILRESNDITDDPEMTKHLRETRLRAKWAEAARSRYHRMTEEERRVHNNKRRNRQNGKHTEDGHDPDPAQDAEFQKKMAVANSRKALLARAKYHRMTPDEKRAYNRKRTEMFRRRRVEEEALLSLPIDQINGEDLDRAQQIVIRNAKRAELARLRYQRMTPEERRFYNRKRYCPKNLRKGFVPTFVRDDDPDEPPAPEGRVNVENINLHDDSLSILEKEVLRRTEQAQQIIRERGLTNSSAITVSHVKPDYEGYPSSSYSYNPPNSIKKVVTPKGYLPSLANTIIIRPTPQQKDNSDEFV